MLFARAREPVATSALPKGQPVARGGDSSHRACPRESPRSKLADFLNPDVPGGASNRGRVRRGAVPGRITAIVSDRVHAAFDGGRVGNGEDE